MEIRNDILYLSNPDFIITSHGNKIKPENAVITKRGIYDREEVFEFNKEFYPLEMEKEIFVDGITKERNIRDGSTNRFIESYNITTKEAVYGSTNYPEYLYNCYDAIYGLGNFHTNNIKLINNLKLIEEIKSGIFVSKEGIVPDNTLHGLRFGYPPKEIVNKDPGKYGVKSSTFSLTNGIRNTFGIEIETFKGTLGSHSIKDLGINGVYDGSIRDENDQKVGTEYTTLPQIGDMGFYHVKKVLNELIRTNHKINKSCSIHVHIGGASWTPVMILALVKVCKLIEEEIFCTIPATRMKSTHCNFIKLPSEILTINSNLSQEDITKKYLLLKKVIGCTNEIQDISKKRQHPLGPKCGFNHDTPRYWWVNLVPTMFDMRENGVYTVEFRHHSATLNYKKIKNLVLLCIAIVNFADTRTEFALRCDKLSIERILRDTYGKKADVIISYYEERKEFFSAESDTKEYQLQNNKKTNDVGIKSIYE